MFKNTRSSKIVYHLKWKLTAMYIDLKEFKKCSNTEFSFFGFC